jgi:hypothetical protein
VIREPHELENDPEVRDVLKAFPRDGSLMRASFAGRPFHVEGHGSNPWRAEEAVIERMIAAGLLRVTNASPRFTPELGWKAPPRPWRVRLTPLGDTVRRAII